MEFAYILGQFTGVLIVFWLFSSPIIALVYFLLKGTIKKKNTTKEKGNSKNKGEESFKISLWHKVLIVLFFPYYAIWYMWAKLDWGQKFKWVFTILFGVLWLTAISASGYQSNTIPENTPKQTTKENKEVTVESPKEEPKKEEPKKEEPKQQTQPQSQPQPQPTQSSDVDKINSLVREVGSFEVTVLDANSNPANATTPLPFQVIVNTQPNQLSCYSSQDALFNINKKIFTDGNLKSKVSRVLFSSWGSLRSSFGSADNDFDWNPAVSSGFWKAMLQLKPYEDETGALQNRTWGVSINGCK